LHYANYFAKIRPNSPTIPALLSEISPISSKFVWVFDRFPAVILALRKRKVNSAVQIYLFNRLRPAKMRGIIGKKGGRAVEQNIQTGKRIQQRREELGLNLGDIAKEVGVAVSTIQRYEKGKIEKIKLPVIEAIAKALQVDPAWLLCQTDRMTVSSVEVSSISNLIPLPQTYRIPLVGEIACGSPILAEENVEEILEIPQHIKADFALRCHGDSMIGVHIHDGDIVYIRQQPDVDNGSIAAVCIENSATLKRVYKYPDKLVLSPANPQYEPLVYTGDELSQVRILGKAVGFISLIH